MRGCRRALPRSDVAHERHKQGTAKNAIMTARKLLPVGLALMFVPQLTMKLLLTNHAYDDLGLRMGGVFLFAIGMIVSGMIINEASRAYPVTLFVRAFIITALFVLYAQYGDPALLAINLVVAIGWVLTFLGWRKDKAEQRG
jgi:hypothetical protein